MPSSNHDSHTTPGANSAQKARARSYSYSLFSRLFLSPITAEILPYLQAVDELQAALPQSINLEELAADHHQLFAFNVFPYEAVFLDDSGLLGGAVTDAVRRRYQQAGYHVDATASSPDHIGHELGLLAFLSAAEADAHEDREQQHVHRLRRHQSEFLEHHLLRWLPPLTLALRDHQLPFYARVGQMTLQLVQEQMADLHGSAPRTPEPLPPAPQPLQDSESGLSEIAAFLVTPLHSGLYLSRETIGALARELDLPRGFGSRKQLLLNTLRSAAQYERLDAVLDALQALAAEWADGLASVASGPSAPFVAVWQERVVATRNMLREMQAQRETHAQSEYNRLE